MARALDTSLNTQHKQHCVIKRQKDLVANYQKESVDIKTNVLKGPWAAQNRPAGRMWPAGRGLSITDLNLFL